MTRLALLAIVGAAFSLIANATSAQGVAGDPVAGKTKWTDFCAPCHGSVPSTTSAPVLGASYSPAGIVDAISNVPQMAQAGGLKVLTATDMANIGAYLGGVLNTATPNMTGLWWNAPGGSEAGWGINIAHQYNLIFMSWFTYDASGKAWWMVMTAARTGVNAYGGTLYSGHGPAFNSVPFPPLGVSGGAVAQVVGAGTITFTDRSNATFTYTVNGITQTKSITRELIGVQPSCLFVSVPDYSTVTNYQDIWWAYPAGAEAGWGINLTQSGDEIYATWYTFGADGAPLWLVATVDNTGGKTYSGPLYQTSGPAFNAVPFPPLGSAGGPTGAVVGSMALTFTDGNHATFAYTANGISQTKAITRQIFSSPPSVCQ